ncbi:MAG: hypothetical protein KAR06_03075 [Deltaproteobacteria bacterium]|nr:hypothetical protein [Deltaproteobacteria bacterium]
MADLADKANEMPFEMTRKDFSLTCKGCGAEFTDPKHLEDELCEPCYYGGK